MNITPDIIRDLLPLYAANECSPDTRALVEEHLRHNPREAEELRKVQQVVFPNAAPVTKQLDEMRAFREARRLLRLRSWLLGLAIFFSLAPFSFFGNGEHTFWLLRDAPKAALIYAACGVGGWIAYAAVRRRSQSL